MLLEVFPQISRTCLVVGRTIVALAMEEMETIKRRKEVVTESIRALEFHVVQASGVEPCAELESMDREDAAVGSSGMDVDVWGDAGKLCTTNTH